MVEGKSLKTQYLVSYVPMEGGYGGGPHRRQGEPTSSANYESSPGQILSLLQTVLSVCLPGSESVTMTQIVSTLASLLQGVWHPSHRLLADGLSQHGCCQVHDNHLASKDRHNYGHEMTPGGLSASLPGSLTESMVWSKDRIWPLAELMGSP